MISGFEFVRVPSSCPAMQGWSGIFARMRCLDGDGRAFVCVTLVQAVGSVPQEVGAKMLVTATGRDCGTIGGGRVEEAAIRHAANLLINPSAPACQLVEWNLQSDIGMTCGGVVTFLFERFDPASWVIAIFGAGHVSQALVRILMTLNCAIRVFDTRPEMLALMPSHGQLVCRLVEPLADAVEMVPDGAFVAVMTQGHRTDLPVLTRILQTREFPYLGVIGSASKAAVLRRELRDAGITGDLKSRLRCPIGLPFGRDTPDEIAVSIAAELLQVRGA